MNKERKIILIVGAILLLIGAIYRFGPDPESLFSANKEIELKTKKLARYRQLVQERNSLEEKRLALTRTLERAESALLTGDTPALAAVDIQNLINDIAGRSDIDIRTLRVLKPPEDEEESYLMAIPVQVSLTGEIRQLKQLLYRIVSASKILKITELRIRAVNPRKPEAIQATFTVSGYMKKGSV